MNKKELEFNKLLNNAIKNKHYFKSKKGKERYYPSNDEKFKQINSTNNSNSIKYKSFREDISDAYFIGENGTLLRLNKNNEITLVENSNKKSTRRTYSLYFKSLKKHKTIRDYHLVAIVFESVASKTAEELLMTKGIKAFDYGLEIHHIKGTENNHFENLNITMKKQHIFLHKKAPSCMNDELSQLRIAHDLFEGKDRVTCIFTNHILQTNKTYKNETSRYSEICYLNNSHDVEMLMKEATEFISNTQYTICEIYYQEENCYICIDNLTHKGTILNSEFTPIREFTEEIMNELFK